MKFYKVKYVSDLNGMGGLATQYKIQILEKYRGDEGLLAHELVHVKAWYVGLAVCLLLAVVLAWQLSWIAVIPALLLGWNNQKVMYRWKWYRGWIEGVAYRVQLGTGGKGGFPYLSPEFAVVALMRKYGLGWSREEAEGVLGLAPGEEGA